MKLSDFNNINKDEVLGKIQREPEEEYFHSIYFTAKKRKMGDVVLQRDKLHIYGVDYNKDEVFLIPMKFKMVLEKIDTIKSGKEFKKKTLCFSFMDGRKSSTGRICPANSAERRSDVFCSSCRASLYMIGMLCDRNGKPVNGIDGKPALGFVKGRGIKFSSIFNYYKDVIKLDPEKDFSDGQIFEWASRKDKRTEQNIANPKRFIVRITLGETTGTDGEDYTTFVLERGKEIPKSFVIKLLKLEDSDEFQEEFLDKFDKTNSKVETNAETNTTLDNIIKENKNDDKNDDDDNNSEDDIDDGVGDGGDSVFEFDDIEL